MRYRAPHLLSECRICYEGTAPLLKNVCACRGSMAYIHRTCLQATRETTCSVCHAVYPVGLLGAKAAVPAAAAAAIATPWICTGVADLWLRCFLFGMGMMNMLDAQSILWIQRGLVLLYIRTYVPLRPWRPWRFWFRLWILDDRQHLYFPLAGILAWCLTLYMPYAILYMNAYRYVWQILAATRPNDGGVVLFFF